MSVDEVMATTAESHPNGPNNFAVRILVADDQPANIQIVGNMLGKLG